MAVAGMVPTVGISETNGAVAVADASPGAAGNECLSKAIEELAGGDYSPSPGVIYPTLTLLEERGQATVTLELSGKKQYGITAEGAAILDSQRDLLTRILGRLDSAGSVAGARRAPELNPGALRTIADAIDRAAVEIERS